MTDTIAAIATGSAVCAVGIVRVSGPEAISAADRVFKAKSGRALSDIADRKLVLGALVSADGHVLDECLCTISRGPNSYTGEDTAELHCHGSPVVLAAALRALFACGVRQAGPGEFTKRAFLNGHMDLAQAEAVIDLIEAESETAAVIAAGQLGGALSVAVNRIYECLLAVSSHYFAVIDYPDEDIEPFELTEYKGTLISAAESLERLLATYDRGRVLKDGVRTAIIGRPNAGKSSLLNALAGYERAIVTATAGTTRDTIEEKIRLKSTVLRLVDTAGIRETGDEIEQLGIARAKKAAESAELVIAVFDGSQPLTADDLEVMSLADSVKNSIAVVNKFDLALRAELDTLRQRFERVILLSARTGEGLDRLESEAEAACGVAGAVPTGELLTNARHADAIRRALESVRASQSALESAMTPDAVLTEIETAMLALGELTGRTIREDITSEIFGRFCVGK